MKLFFESSNEDGLKKDCLSLYKKLDDIYYTIDVNSDNPLQEYADAVKKMYALVGGRVRVDIYSNSIKADGVIYGDGGEKYTLANFIGIAYQRGDFTRLIEDLVMAHYRLNGGEMTYTPSVMKEIGVR